VALKWFYLVLSVTNIPTCISGSLSLTTGLYVSNVHAVLLCCYYV